MDERSGRKGIGTPEVEGGLVGSRIPVATSDALEEGRYVESHPVETQSERVVVTGQRVADDAFVARIVHGARTFGDDVVAVEVGETDIARAQTVAGRPFVLIDAVIDRLVVDQGLVFGGFAVGFEQTFDVVSPDFAQRLTFVAVGDHPIRIVVFGDFGNVVTHGSRYVVREGFPRQLEFVLPTQRYLPALCAQVGAVGFRSIGAEDAGQRERSGEHVLRIADIIVSGEIETIVQKAYVESDVVGGYGFPRQTRRERIRDVGIKGFFLSVEGIVHLIVGADLLDVGIVGYLLIAQTAYRKTQFEVVDDVPCRGEERLLADAPCGRRRGEESPAMVGLEARRTVAAGARLENVAALVVVIHTSEESQRTVGRDRLREGDGARRYREGVDVVARQVGLFCVERG